MKDIIKICLFHKNNQLPKTSVYQIYLTQMNNIIFIHFFSIVKKH